MSAATLWKCGKHGLSVVSGDEAQIWSRYGVIIEHNGSCSGFDLGQWAALVDVDDIAAELEDAHHVLNSDTLEGLGALVNSWRFERKHGWEGVRHALSSLCDPDTFG